MRRSDRKSKAWRPHPQLALSYFLFKGTFKNISSESLPTKYSKRQVTNPNRAKFVIYSQANGRTDNVLTILN